jgi:hypothetical protein
LPSEAERRWFALFAPESASRLLGFRRSRKQVSQFAQEGYA